MTGFADLSFNEVVSLLSDLDIGERPGIPNQFTSWQECILPWASSQPSAPNPYQFISWEVYAIALDEAGLSLPEL